MSELNEAIEKGATHEHKGNDEFLPHFIKVYRGNILADHYVKVFVDNDPYPNDWYGDVAWDKNNLDNYIKINK